MKSISLNKEVSLDIERLVQGRLAILANSGGGKSWAIRRVAEQASGKVQTIILDDEGEFFTLREKHDFILCGVGQDVPVEIRSSAMLATMLLEARASAIVDLSELSPRDKKTFVRIFLETMVNAPKSLWHQCLVILDEAHDYAPEGKPSEASLAVESMASKGRKRGFALIPASQRISKISKDVLSECSNVMIGKATWAIDRKRAQEELGLSKEDALALKNFKPGEFYTTGPAISDDLIRIQVGEVKTSHGKTAELISAPMPPSAALKKALAKLAELPAEVEKEAKTSAELKEQIVKLKREIIQGGKVGFSKEELEAEVNKRLAGHVVAMESEREAWKQIIGDFKQYGLKISSLVEGFNSDFKAVKIPDTKPGGGWKNPEIADFRSRSKPVILPGTKVISPSENSQLNGLQADMIILDEVRDQQHNPEVKNIISGPEQRILNALAWFASIGINEPEQTAVAFLAGYKVGGGAYNNPRGSLRVKGLIEYLSGDALRLTPAGAECAEYPDHALTNEKLHTKVMERLPGPEKKLLQPLLDAYPEPMTNEMLAELSGYAVGGGAFNNPRGRLRTLGLIEYLPNNLVRARDLLFPNN